MFKILKRLFPKSDNTELNQVITDGALLVDVRSEAEYRSGSVKTAINIPLDRIASQLSKFAGKKNIVVFCRSGNRSSQAKKILAQAGFPHVINGGTWQNVNKAINNK